MKCFYCYEEIHNNALVCKHCGRDFLFVSPLLDKISNLEHQVHDLRNELQIIKSGPVGLNTKSTDPFFPKALYYSTILLGSFAAIAFYYLFYIFETDNKLYLVLSICSPIPAGFWMGYKLKILNYKLFLGGGAILGLLNTIGVQIIYGEIFTETDDLIPVIGLYIIGGVLLYLSGGLIGNWLARKRKTNRQSLPEQIANSILNNSYDRNSNSYDQNAKTEKIKKIIEILTPILTFTATIVAAFFTYLAATNK